jgi:hypothetical protein
MLDIPLNICYNTIRKNEENKKQKEIETMNEMEMREFYEDMETAFADVEMPTEEDIEEMFHQYWGE